MLQGFIVAELGGIKSTDSRLDVADIESFHALSETVLLRISAKTVETTFTEFLKGGKDLWR